MFSRLQYACQVVISLLSREQCPQFERIRLEHVQMVNKTSSLKGTFIGNNAESIIIIRSAL